jgi:serine/threonine protein phosphatase PrpC
MRGVIIPEPEVTSFTIGNDTDFLILGCDGIFDELTNHDVIDCAWLTMDESTRSNKIHVQTTIAVDMVMKTAMTRKSLDNVTCVLVAFQNFENHFMKYQKPQYVAMSPKLSSHLQTVIEDVKEEMNIVVYSHTEPDESPVTKKIKKEGRFKKVFIKV